MILIALGVVAADLWRERRQTGQWQERSLFSLLLVLLAGAMLARMFLRSRVDHFGFFQSSLAAMVVAAVVVSKIPPWTGAGAWGRRVALLSIMAMLGLGCASIAAQSAAHRADQTQPVASGVDRFYADAPDIDETGLLADWSVRRLRSIPPGANLLVLPEGLMINYLSRRPSPHLPELQADPDAEARYVRLLARSPPDYVLWLTRDMRESGVTQYGAPGNPGAQISEWLRDNYVLEDHIPAVSKTPPSSAENHNASRRAAHGRARLCRAVTSSQEICPPTALTTTVQSSSKPPGCTVATKSATAPNCALSAAARRSAAPTRCPGKSPPRKKYSLDW